jgi:hypothetical protein
MGRRTCWMHCRPIWHRRNQHWTDSLLFHRGTGPVYCRRADNTDYIRHGRLRCHIVQAHRQQLYRLFLACKIPRFPHRRVSTVLF